MSIEQRIADVLAEHGFRTCQGCIDAAMEDAALDTTDPPRTRRLAHVAAAIQAELQLTEETRPQTVWTPQGSVQNGRVLRRAVTPWRADD